MLKLLCITAHPDDEAGAFGGTLLLYSERGVATSVVCLTAGTAAKNRGTARTNEELAELRTGEPLGLERTRTAPRGGSWVSCSSPKNRQAVFRRDFEIDSPRHAWMRVTSRSPFRLAINGNLLDEHEERIGTFVSTSWSVDDLDKTYAELSANGVEFDGPPQKQPWGSFAIIKDSEGNSIVLSGR